MGDPAGIGPEITVRAWQARTLDSLPAFFVLGDPRLYQSVPVQEIADPADVPAVFASALPVLPVALPHPARPSQPDTAFGPSIIASIDRAVAMVKDGAARAVVTNPIAKALLYRAGFRAPGHTEYLARLCGLADTAAVMMLVGGGLRVVPATIHVPLAEVPLTLTPALLESVVRITLADLHHRFGIERPRVTVAGLNPHAGEAGRIGTEERDWIAPLCDRLRGEGLAVTGPAPADALFHAEARQSYDAAVCCYHDQALIPVKTLAFHDGVNVTLGLPIVRTSPDHGTAFDIAGTGLARPDSLIAALKLAADLA
ncbi:MAG: 4-hydroxythreonine-4-phosphate dehydrogenase PdxA [Rhodothalassiaceae bacterium]